MLLLALDTSSPVVVAALHDGADVVAVVAEEGAQAHGELLAPVVRRALSAAGARAADLTTLVTGVGPGPFTGLRVGIVTARVMGEALGVPVHGVCSLDVLAFRAVADGTVTAPFAVAADARRKEVHLRRYDAEGVALGPPTVVRPGDIGAGVAAGPVVGPGARLYPGTFADPRPPSGLDGEALARLAARALAGGGGLLAPDPLYLRRPDAVANAARKRVTRP